jgi:xylitol oxidase
MLQINWAGNIRYSSASWHQPKHWDEIPSIVRNANQLRVVGSRHSFSDLADSPDSILCLDDLPKNFVIDADRAQVEVSGNVRYGDLCPSLHSAGFALPNLASLPHLSVAGATATGTHGSGVNLRCLSDSVHKVEFIVGDGSVRRIQRGDPDFEGAVVHLGCLGVVSRLWLDLIPAFEVCQWVFHGPSWERLRSELPDLMSKSRSVSLFTGWQDEGIDQVWMKGIEAGRPEVNLDSFDTAVHPIASADPVRCTEQLGVAGPWFERLPHFKLAYTPSFGEELQSEYFVGREDAVAAIEVLLGIRDRLRPLVLVSEIRSVAADHFWLSPAFGRDSIAFHFTWKPDQAAVDEVLEIVEDALAPFGPRPHWGKRFRQTAARLETVVPRLVNFRELVGRWDSAGKFLNPYTDRVLGIADERG